MLLISGHSEFETGLLHLKTDIALIVSRFVRYRFRVEFNAEFPRQVMNVPIKCNLIVKSDECDIGFQVQFNAEFTSQVMNFP